MKRSRFTQQQIIGVLKEHQAGATAADLCRKQGISDATCGSFDVTRNRSSWRRPACDDGNSRTVVIANQNEGTLAVCDLERAEVLRTVRAGVGVEALSFF